MNFKVVISDPKSKKAYQKEIDQKQSLLLQKKIGEKVSGQSLGLTGYELEITGGSDKDGFPMRRDVDGTGRKKILLSRGTGMKDTKKGIRKRKSVRGNTISSSIAQINLKVTGHGQKSIEELLGVKKQEKPAEEKNAEKKEESKAGKPAEEKIAVKDITDKKD